MYTVRRNPSYKRKKKNSEGETTENANATLETKNYTCAGEKNVNAEIEAILGVDYKRFKYIGMLAQGEFLKLLHADSKERSEIFRKVFDTTYFQSFQNVLKSRTAEISYALEKNTDAVKQYCEGITPESEESELAKLLCSSAAKRLRKLDPNTAKYMISVCSNDLNILINELEKLEKILNAEKGEKTTEQVLNKLEQNFGMYKGKLETPMQEDIKKVLNKLELSKILSKG